MPRPWVRTLVLSVPLLLILGVDLGSSRAPQPHRVVATPVESPAARPPEIEALAPERSGRDGTLPLPAALRHPDARRVSLEIPPAPDRVRPPASPDAERRILTFDRRTGEVTERTIEGAEAILGPRYTRQGIGLHQLLEDPEGVAKIFSDWTEVPDPTVGDYPRRVKLFLWFEDVNGVVLEGGCSGTLIDPMHVITAAHCIWSHEAGGLIIQDYAQDVEVIPGYENGQRPFGSAGFSQLHVWSEWTDFQDYDHDIGIIDLDRPIGALSGWWGYGASSDCAFFESPLWHHAGYPTQDPFDGEILYENSGDFDLCVLPGYDNRIQWNGTSYKGLSGTGSLKTPTGAVYAVVSTGEGVISTQCCRLTDLKYDQIGQMILEDKPTTLDLLALDVRADDTVSAGASLSVFDFLVLNYSQDTMGGNWPFDIYLSPDPFIDTGDVLLGSASFDYSFEDNGRVRVTPALLPVIPADTPTGDYHLGVLLTHVDANPANNASQGQESHPIFVDGTPVVAPTLLAPADGSICVSTSPTCSWQPVAPVADYQIRLGDLCGTGTTYDLSTTSHSFSGLEPLTTYQWQVRGRPQGGTWSDWSPCWAFTTASDPSELAVPVAPPDGSVCEGRNVPVEWTPLPDAESYDLQYGAGPCEEGTILSGIPYPMWLLGQLEPGTSYQWRVRAHSFCGLTTDWSPCYGFTTAPLSVDPPLQIDPPDGTGCAAASTLLSWDPMDGAESYEVFVGSDCTTGTITATSASEFAPPDLASGQTYLWRVRVVHACGLVSEWTDCWSFSLDLAPPLNPPSLSSGSHALATWSADDTVDVGWEPGADDCSGAAIAYATLWDTKPLSVPTEPTTFALAESSPPLADGQGHWFHLRAVDGAGNLALSTLHLGPFWIDRTPPEAPAFEYSNLDEGATLGPTTLILDWTPAVDATSGVAGYSWAVNSYPMEPPELDDTIDLSETTLALPLNEPGNVYLFLRAVDATGNGSPSLLFGPITLDPGYVGALVTAPGRGEVLTEGELYRIQWDFVEEGTGKARGGQLAWSTDAGQSYTILLDPMDTAQIRQRYYDWTVPAAASSEAVVRVTLYDQFQRPVAVRSERFTLVQKTGVDEPPIPRADLFALHPNRPNPFNPQTTIAYTLPHDTEVRLRVYDAAGRLVRTLVEGMREGPATHEAIWDGRDEAGLSVSSGVYRAVLETATFRQSRPMVLVK